jgi:hypothetical protein
VSPPSHLKPSESLTEIVAGLIMVLTFTLAASVLTGGGQDGARAALLGAIGCNAAWGIIDAVFYMMTSAFDRNRRLRLARAIAATPDEAAALAAIRSELDPLSGFGDAGRGPRAALPERSQLAGPWTAAAANRLAI